MKAGKRDQEGWIKVAGMDGELGQHGEVRLIRDACSESRIKRLDQRVWLRQAVSGRWIRQAEEG
jgi:hypothetical protein